MRMYRLILISALLGVSGLRAVEHDPVSVRSDEQSVSAVPELSYDQDDGDDVDLFLNEVPTPPPSPINIWFQSQGARLFMAYLTCKNYCTEKGSALLQWIKAHVMTGVSSND